MEEKWYKGSETLPENFDELVRGGEKYKPHIVCEDVECLTAPVVVRYVPKFNKEYEYAVVTRIKYSFDSEWQWHNLPNEEFCETIEWHPVEVGGNSSNIESRYKINWNMLGEKFDEYISLVYGNTPVMDTGSDYDVYAHVLDELIKEEKWKREHTLKKFLKKILWNCMQKK